jgi:hypothetical protein
VTERHLWWQRGVIYQVYPRSFADSDDDGIGDLEGVRARLDYLEWLGVDAIWLSPIFPSPMVDFGYDVAAAGHRFVIALNFADRPGTLSLGPELGGGRLELSTMGITEGEAQVADALRLRPNEGVVVRVASPSAAR